VPTEPRYELALVRPALAPQQVAVERGSVVPRAALAAALSPVLTYWLPSRVMPRIAESGVVTDVFVLALVAMAMALVGAYVAVVVAMRARRISELAPPVTPLEAMLVILLGIFAPTLPWLLGSGTSLTSSLVIQATTVFMAILTLGGVLGDGWRVPFAERETLVRALVAGLLPTVILFALLPAVVANAVLSSTPTDPSSRVLMIWVAATLVGVVAGVRGWPTGEPPLVRGLTLVALAAGAAALAALVWSVGDGISATGAVFLVQPVAIAVAVVLLGARPERTIAEPASAVTPTPVVRPPADPLLVPTAGSTFIGRSETPHQDPATGRRETRIEARWLVQRPFALVTADYRGREDLKVRKETPTELILARGAPSPAAVRITAQAARTEVRVRVAAPA
jgi:hypothetical protein